jgi:hypothetical protein
LGLGFRGFQKVGKRKIRKRGENLSSARPLLRRW